MDGMNSSIRARTVPVHAAANAMRLTFELPSPMASSMPWMGNGVCTSHFLKP